MTTKLEEIYINNSQLFKVDVFDIDGVTKLTPSACLCDIWNMDTNTQVIINQAGIVGDGFAQYNWAGNATAAQYEAVLTVTISAGVVKSEHFLIDVLAKPPAAGISNPLIRRVRRMTGELKSTTYNDAEILEFIEAHPLVDSEGYSPYQSNWTATYDLNAAAADIWEEKASVRTEDHDFTADGGEYSRSQMYAMAMKQARHYRSRRSPGTIELEGTPKDNSPLDDDEDEE